MSHTEGKLIQKGNFAYQLMHAGWRKGEEQFKNRLSFQVYADKDAGETDEDITRRLVACWNYCIGMPTEHLEAGADWKVEARALIAHGHLVSAVKHCRAKTGWGLKVAVDAVRSLQAEAS
jgi:hypothetical protein